MLSYVKNTKLSDQKELPGSQLGLFQNQEKSELEQYADLQSFHAKTGHQTLGNTNLRSLKSAPSPPAFPSQDTKWPPEVGYLPMHSLIRIMMMG